MLILTIGIVASLLGPSLAQIVGGIDVTKLPTCAQGCLAGNTNAASGCAITDVHCLCTSIPYINALYCCLQRDCSTDEQNTALAFNIALCNQYNVTIPDFIGCSPLSSSAKSHSSYSIPRSLPSVPTASTTSNVNVSTVTALKPAPALTSLGPLAAFSPRPLLTGSCAVPAIASTALSDTLIQEFPWVGCFSDAPDCCAFDVRSPGPLGVCPDDFTTTASACCPSGWSVYTSGLAGQTPCATSPAIPLIASAPKSASAGGPSTSAISTLLFTQRYLLQSPSPAGLTGGAKAGIAIGVIAGVAALAGLAFFLVRRRRQRARAIRDATATRSSHGTVDDVSPTSPMSKFTVVGTTAPGSPRRPSGSVSSPSELPSPPLGSGSWGAKSPVGSSGPPVEMPGSTFIHEHHPAFGQMLEAPATEAGTRPGLKPLAVDGLGGGLGREAYRPPFASVERLPGASTVDLREGRG